jgi:hypothetical protein
MMAHKFLAKGGHGPITGFAWPVPQGEAPGAWVAVEGRLAQCARGVHVCRLRDLAHWIHEELWEIEADGEPTEGLDCVVVQRGRLVRRVDAWSDEGRKAFARACIDHAVASTGPQPPAEIRDLLGDAGSMNEGGYVAIAAFTSALAVSRMARPTSGERAYREERAWQSAWIAERLLA